MVDTLSDNNDDAVLEAIYDGPIIRDINNMLVIVTETGNFMSVPQDMDYMIWITYGVTNIRKHQHHQI